jgi:uncharacterized protein YndB with AHSA1/START domain
VKDSPTTAKRSQTIRAPHDRVWRLLASPEAFSAYADWFAFDIELPSASLRVVLGTSRKGRPVMSCYEVRDDQPGEAISLHHCNPQEHPSHVLTLSAQPHGRRTLATIAVRFPAAQSSTINYTIRDHWLFTQAVWLADLRKVAEGRAPHPGQGMPDNIRSAFTPSAPLRQPLSVSVAADVAAPADKVWRVIYRPESAVLLGKGCLSSGVVPGTPVGQVGEMQYFVHRVGEDGFSVRVIVVTELNVGRSAVVSSIDPEHDEVLHVVTPHGHGSRLELVHRWPAQMTVSSHSDYAERMTDQLKAALADYKDLSENAKC